MAVDYRISSDYRSGTHNYSRHVFGDEKTQGYRSDWDYRKTLQTYTGRTNHPIAAAITSTASVVTGIDMESALSTSLSSSASITAVIVEEASIASAISGSASVSTAIKFEAFIASALTATGSEVTVLIEEASIASALTATATVSAALVHDQPITSSLSAVLSTATLIIEEALIAAALTSTASVTTVIRLKFPQPAVTLSKSLHHDVTLEVTS